MGVEEALPSAQVRNPEGDISIVNACQARLQVKTRQLTSPIAPDEDEYPRIQHPFSKSPENQKPRNTN